MTTHIDDLALLKDIVGSLPLARGEEIIVDSLLSGGVVSVVGKGFYVHGKRRIPWRISWGRSTSSDSREA
jgi:hypothetical protein